MYQYYNEMDTDEDETLEQEHKLLTSTTETIRIRFVTVNRDCAKTLKGDL